MIPRVRASDCSTTSLHRARSVARRRRGAPARRRRPRRRASRRAPRRPRARSPRGRRPSRRVHRVADEDRAPAVPGRRDEDRLDRAAHDLPGVDDAVAHLAGRAAEAGEQLAHEGGLVLGRHAAELGHRLDGEHVHLGVRHGAQAARRAGRVVEVELVDLGRAVEEARATRRRRCSRRRRRRARARERASGCRRRRRRGRTARSCRLRARPPCRRAPVVDDVHLDAAPADGARQRPAPDAPPTIRTRCTRARATGRRRAARAGARAARR